MDLDVECGRLMDLTGREAILDVGCGPGRFPIFLRNQGHQERLVGRRESSPFTIENATEILASVFPRVDDTLISNALVFTSPEPIVRYIATTFPSLDVQGDERLWSEMESWLHDEARRRLAQLGGVWRDPKDVGIYRCKVAG